MKEEYETLDNKLKAAQIKRLQIQNDRDMDRLVPKEEVDKLLFGQATYYNNLLKTNIDIRKVSLFRLIYLKLRNWK